MLLDTKVRKVARVISKCFHHLIVAFLLIPLSVSSSIGDVRRSDSSPRKSAKVVAIYDGDTIKVRFASGLEHRIRMIGIDAPELNETKEETQLEAFLAKRFVFHHLYQKTVGLTYERELEDKYGRLLAYVWTEQGLFNEFILKQGFARVFWAFSYDLKERFFRAEQESRQNERGLWQKKPYPLAPALEIRNHIGKLRRVRFVCVQMRRRGRFLFLYPDSRNFSILIPQENLPFFPGWKSWEGSLVEAAGFLEEYKGQAQIMVFFPIQLKVLEGK